MKLIIALGLTLLISSSAWVCGSHVDFSTPHIHDHDALMVAAAESNQRVPKTINIDEIFGGQLSQSHDSEHSIERKSEHNIEHQVEHKDQQ